MKNHFRVTNVHNLEELGMLYASMNNLEYHGDKKNSIQKGYEELGKTVCKAYKGYLRNGCFYGRIPKD